MRNKNQAAFPGAFCTEGILAVLALKLSGKEVCKSNFGKGILIIFCRNPAVCVTDPDAYVRGRGEWIALYMVDGQDIVYKLISSFS